MNMDMKCATEKMKVLYTTVITHNSDKAAWKEFKDMCCNFAFSDNWTLIKAYYLEHWHQHCSYSQLFK